MQEKVVINKLLYPSKTILNPNEKPNYEMKEPKKGKIKIRLFKALIKIMERITLVTRKYEYEKIIQSKQVDVDLKRVEKTIFEQVRRIEELNIQDFYIIMGLDQLPELIEQEVPFNLTFPEDYESSTTHRGEKVEYKGMEIIVIPWMEGILVVPKI